MTYEANGSGRNQSLFNALCREWGERGVQLGANGLHDLALSHPERMGMSETETEGIAKSVVDRYPPGDRATRPREVPAFNDPRDELAHRRRWTRAALDRLGCEAKGQEVRIPMRDAEGRVTGWKRRRGDNEKINGQKSPTLKGGKAGLFIALNADDPDGEVLITEGEADAAAGLSAGWRNVIGTAGSNPGKEIGLPSLQKIASGRRVVLAPDPDKAGAKWRDTVARRIVNAGGTVRFIPPGETDLDARLRNDDDRANTLRKLIEAGLPWTKSGPAAGAVEIDPADPLAVAKLFIDRHYQVEGRPVMLFVKGDFLAYRDGIYETIEPAAMRAELYNFLALCTGAESDTIRPNRKLVDNVLDALRAAAHFAFTSDGAIWLDRHKGDPDPEICLVMANGILRVDTRELLPHSPRLYVRHKLRFDYDPGAGEPGQWNAFLDSIFAEDFEARATLAEWFGLTLLPITRFQKILAVIGPRRAGKRIIATVNRKLVGKESTCAPTLGSLAGNFGLASLRGKLLGQIPDARLSARSDAARIIEVLLSISGEDPLDIDRKFLDPVTERLPLRLSLYSNEVPGFADASSALPGRFIVIRLTRSFYGREDLHLEEKVLAELPAIFLWALDGLDRLIQRGRFIQPASGAGLVESFNRVASPVAEFIEDRCEVHPHRTVFADELFQVWTAWCGESRKPGTPQNFAKDIHAAVPGLTTRQSGKNEGRRRFWEGIGLNSDDTGPEIGHASHAVPTIVRATGGNKKGQGGEDIYTRSKSYSNGDRVTCVTNPPPHIGADPSELANMTGGKDGAL